MHAALLFPKEYLGAADLLDKKTGKPLDVTLTISRLVMEELRTDKGSEDKWCLYFKEIEDRHRDDRKKLNKRLVLNRTNAKSIAKVLGNETNEWVGRQITLYPTTCMAFGKEAECIRIREKAPAKGKPSSSPDALVEPPADHVSP